MVDDYIRALFFRDYKDAKELLVKTDEKVKEDNEINEESKQIGNDSIIEHKTANDKFLKMAEYANEISEKLGWFISVEIHKEHIGVIWLKADAICFSGFEAERIKFEALLGMAEEYIIVNNRFEPDMLEIELRVELSCEINQ